MTQQVLIPLFIAIPACTNPLCPATGPHLVAEFGFDISSHSPDLHVAFHRLLRKEPHSGDLEKIARFQLCHGGAFSFIKEADGQVQCAGLCPNHCHAAKQADMLKARRTGMQDSDRQAMLSFQCQHGVRPVDTVVRGKFVRSRSTCPFADLAIQQGMIAASDVLNSI